MIDCDSIVGNSSLFGTNADDMLSIVLTKEEHATYTKAWRKAIGYANDGNPLNTMTATKDDVVKVAKEIYKDSPEILNAMGL